MGWAFDYLQRDATVDGHTGGKNDWLADADGGSVYLRLSTRACAQRARDMHEQLASNIVDGGYWLETPSPGTKLAIAYTAPSPVKPSPPMHNCRKIFPVPDCWP